MACAVHVAFLASNKKSCSCEDKPEDGQDDEEDKDDNIIDIKGFVFVLATASYLLADNMEVLGACITNERKLRIVRFYFWLLSTVSLWLLHLIIL